MGRGRGGVLGILHNSSALHYKPDLWDNLNILDIVRMYVPSSSGVANSIIGGGGGGHIFIYSCSTQLISFEIDCFHGL